MSYNREKWLRKGKIFYFISLHLLAIVGLIFIAVFFAIRLKLTNVSGSVDKLSESFENRVLQNRVLGASTEQTQKTDEINNIDNQIEKLSKSKELKIKNLCSLNELSYIAPKNVGKILEAEKTFSSDLLTSQMIFAIETHWDKKDEYDQSVLNCINNYSEQKINQETILGQINGVDSRDIFMWPDTEEWKVVEASIVKDKDIINKAAVTANIEPRLIVSDLMVEQLRIFFSARELYKKYFEPLKILSNSNKISLGVMAIKEDTAAAIENHLKDASSPYYLGPEYEHLLDYPSEENKAQTRYDRLTENSHYYNYLYGALYLKQMIKQWKEAGFDISNRPEIIGTLFNVGFPQSKPNANPKVGGSEVQIGTNKYSFGRLSYEFYYSGELLNEFPYLSNL